MDGTRGLEEIKKIPLINAVPVIVYTISSSYFDISRVKERGAEHYFVKPTNPDFLEEKLKKLFNHSLEAFLIKES